MEDLKEKVRQAIDSYNAHTFDAQIYAQDAKFVTPLRGEVKGKQAIMDDWKQNLETFPDAKVTVGRMISEGNTVAVEYTFEGANTGPLQLPSGETVPATNKRITGPALDILTFEAGQLVSHHQYYDMVHVLAQLGLLPAPAAAPA